MSFFGNNARPDLLKNGDDTRGESSFADTVQAPEPVPSFGSQSSRSSSSYVSASTSSGGGPTAPDQCTNVLASGARWKGSLKVEDSARIDGVFSGEIEAKGTVHVSEGAEVDAKVHALFVVIHGSFRGEIRSEQKTELMPTAKVTGEIYTKRFSVQEGAMLDGAVQMTGDSARPAPNGRNQRNGANADPEAAAERRAARSEAQSSATNQ